MKLSKKEGARSCSFKRLNRSRSNNPPRWAHPIGHKNQKEPTMNKLQTTRTQAARQKTGRPAIDNWQQIADIEYNQRVTLREMTRIAHLKHVGTYRVQYHNLIEHYRELQETLNVLKGIK